MNNPEAVEAVARAIAAVFDDSGIRCTPARSTVVEPLAAAALDAARPFIREELIAELLDSGGDLPSICFRHPMFRTRKEDDDE
jgi:2-C-methyl-D-erythritol 4-phosphate cytidylyltransferase